MPYRRRIQHARSRTTFSRPKQACAKCHQDAQIPAPPATRLAHFNHALHLKMGNVAPLIAAAIDKKTYLQPPKDIRAHLNTGNACEACHRGLGGVRPGDRGGDAADGRLPGVPHSDRRALQLRKVPRQRRSAEACQPRSEIPERPYIRQAEPGKGDLRGLPRPSSFAAWVVTRQELAEKNHCCPPVATPSHLHENLIRLRIQGRTSGIKIAKIRTPGRRSGGCRS